MAVVINTITNLEKLSLINSNFTKLAAAINESLVWRNGSTAGETSFTRDLDLNGYQILNAYVGEYSLSEVVQNANGAATSAAEAAASALQAAGYAASASASAVSAADSASSLSSSVDKLAKIVYPSDFSAIGDGVTDDTAAFVAYEVANTHKQVNLNGQVYKVTAIPRKNYYFNGRWAVTKTTTVSTTTGAGTVYTYTVLINAGDGGSAVPESVPERDARNSQSKIAYKLAQTSGLQGMCFDEPNAKIYAMYFDTSSGSEQTVVNRYDMGTYYPTAATPDLTTLASSQVGHQGLSIEYATNSSPKLWSAVRYDATNFPLGHRQVIRFNVVDGAAPSNVEAYTLFGSEFSYTGNSTMVAVSYDQRWVVAVGRKTSRDFWVRGFDLHMLTSGGAGDYSDSYSWEFNIDDDILADDAGGNYTPVQNVACDGAFVYIVAGNATQQSKKIHQYSLQGRRVGRNNTVSVGLSQSQTDGTFYEPEALAFYKPVGASKPSLAILILTTGRNNYIYEMGSGPRIYSGGWTPTLTAVTNVTATSAFKSNYSRIDDIVHFSGRVSIQATAAGVATIRMSLPVSLVSSSLTQLQGVFNDGTTQGGRIQLDTTTGIMDFTYTANVTTNTAFSFSGAYRVVN